MRRFAPDWCAVNWASCAIEKASTMAGFSRVEDWLNLPQASTNTTPQAAAVRWNQGLAALKNRFNNTAETEANKMPNITKPT